MAWKKVQTLIHDFKENPLIEGKYVERKESDYGGYNYVIETLDGERKLVWGKTALIPKMEALQIGFRVRITYLGDKHSEKTGRTYEDYEVEWQA